MIPSTYRSIAVVFAGMFVVFGTISSDSLTPSMAYAGGTIALTCLSFNPDERAECYRREIPSLYPSQPIRDIFELIELGQRLDPALADCHFVAHRLGEITVVTDPHAWAERLREESSHGICSYGFTHGVTISAFKDGLSEEEIRMRIPDFKQACASEHENTRTGCVHAMGHMSYYVTHGDIARALQLCESVFGRAEDETFSDDRRCYTGAMMLLFFRFIDPDWDEPVRYDLSSENVRSFCATLGDPRYEGACLRASWPLFREVVTSPGGVDRFCAGQPDPTETEWCYAKVSVALGWLFGRESDSVRDLCDAISPEWRETCHVHVMSEYLSGGGVRAVPRAVAFCASLGHRDDAGRCLDSLARMSGRFTRSGSRERAEFCHPIPDRTDRCLSEKDR